ncbi:phosphopantetheine-binding protein [Streptomyces sp. I05A-00742]|uniref:phosphopantetheine-binding protein n=1 Tax=Streptomyces sp. I05A-00742 TaxID=2732853 RepID=UPI0014893C9E|nr:phosphopantetheine-binding protein [Streptomyces sp. I05A-00742]
MTTHAFTLNDLKRILREAAGEQEGSGLAGDIRDLTFEQLGYDSLARLEAGGRIERAYAVALDEDCLNDTTTLGQLLVAVNERITEARAAGSGTARP